MTDVDIIVSGHLCIDLIPEMHHVSRAALNSPGHLSETGALVLSTGGAVSNVGLSLHRLGTAVGLMGTVGDDLIGQLTLQFLAARDPALTRYVGVQRGQPSSYTIALSPENTDRMFLHCPATNDTFGAEHIDFDVVAQAKIFHLGYPPLMARLGADDGAETVRICQQAQRAGAVVSLDMARPDPDGTSGRVNWRRVLENALPHVDIFVPSIEEILFMLRRDDFERWHGRVLTHLTRSYLRTLADELLALGAAVTGFKLGELGIYLRTGGHDTIARLTRRLPLEPALWADVEHWQPAFQVDVVGTTGAGDSAYAGLLTALVRALPPREAVEMACAVGASNVEAYDSNSGIRSWDATAARVRAGWAARSETLPDE